MTELLTPQAAAKVLGVSSRKARLSDKRTALYRHFDSVGALLYVGISLTPFRRLSSHRARSHWADQINRVSVEWLPDRETALAAEFAAILAEKPAHNVDFNHEVRRCLPDPAMQRQQQPRRQSAGKHPEPTLDDMRDAIARIGRRQP